MIFDNCVSYDDLKNTMCTLFIVRGLHGKTDLFLESLLCLNNIFFFFRERNEIQSLPFQPIIKSSVSGIQ